MKLILVLIAISLTGCASLGPSAEQIKEMAGTSSSMCVDAGPTIYSGAISVHYSSFGGKSVGTGGGGGSAACGKSTVTFTNEGKAINIAPGNAPVKDGTVLKNIGTTENPFLIPK